MTNENKKETNLPPIFSISNELRQRLELAGIDVNQIEAEALQKKIKIERDRATKRFDI